jgi:hypothetical protein
MPNEKAMKASAKRTLAALKKEMAKPRVAKSARKEHANLASPVILTKPRRSSGREEVKSHIEGEL